MNALHRITTLVVKELLSYLRDPRTRLILIGPPLLQLLVFSFAATLEVRNVDIAVFDEDSGALSTRFVERLTASSFVNKIKPVSHTATLESLINNRKVLLAIHIPSDFSANAISGRSAVVQIILDGRRANAAQVAANYIATITQQLDAKATLQGQGSSTQFPQIETRHWFNPILSSIWFIVPSLSGVLALLISVLVTSLSIARERELGTFDQLLVSPISPVEIIIGKSLPALIIGSVLNLVMVLAGVFLFRVPFTGEPILLALCVPLFILSGVGIGLSISAICTTQQQAILGAFTVIIPIILTSGFATPVENMPGWLQSISMANPLRHFLIIVQGSFLKSLPAADVLAGAIPLIVIAVVSLSFATWFVRSRLE